LNDKLLDTLVGSVNNNIVIANNANNEYTEDTIFSKLAVIPRIKLLKAIETIHFNLTYIQLLFKSHNIQSDIYYANEMSYNSFKRLLIKIFMKSTNMQFIIVNYDKTKIGFGLNDKIHGRFSPIGAYNCERDAFLIMDVAAFTPLYWVKSMILWKAVNTIEAHKSRGIIIANV
jgi:hypothetical protein